MTKIRNCLLSNFSHFCLLSTNLKQFSPLSFLLLMKNTFFGKSCIRLSTLFFQKIRERNECAKAVLICQTRQNILIMIIVMVDLDERITYQKK